MPVTCAVFFVCTTVEPELQKGGGGGVPPGCRGGTALRSAAAHLVYTTTQPRRPQGQAPSPRPPPPPTLRGAPPPPPAKARIHQYWVTAGRLVRRPVRPRWLGSKARLVFQLPCAQPDAPALPLPPIWQAACEALPHKTAPPMAC